MLSDGDDTIVVLDACVLLPAALRDTLLRLAETPRLYRPRWSREIWAEVTRNLVRRRGLTPGQISHLMHEVEINFPGSFVEPDELLASVMTNHPKDRHVVATAVKCGAQLIVTYNLRDFPKSALSKWKVEARHPDAFLAGIFHLDPGDVKRRIAQQAEEIGRTLPELLHPLRTAVPVFAALIARELS